MTDKEREVSYWGCIHKIDELNSCAEEVIRITPAKTIELSELALELSKQERYKRGIVKSLLNIGKASYSIGNFEKAINCLMDGLQLAQDENFEESEANILNVLGNVNLDLTNYSVALEYYMKSLEIIRQGSYKKSECKVLNNIGEIYKKLKNYETALNYYTQSLEISNLINDENVRCVLLQNLGEVYLYLNNYELAKEYIEESLKTAYKVKDKMIEAACLHKLGKIACSQGSRSEALNLFLESLRISQSTEERFFIISVMIDIYELLEKNHKNDEAIEYLQKALAFAQDTNSKEMIMKIYSYMAKVYEKIGQPDKALYFYKKFHDTERKGTNVEDENKLKNITLQFKMEQSHQEKEIYRLKNVELKEKTEELEKKTAELMESYNNMKIISEIGQSITSTLDFEKILDLVYDSVNNLMPAHIFGIALYHEKTRDIEYTLLIEDSKRIPVYSYNINSRNSWAAWCISNKRELLVNDADEEYRRYFEDKEITYRVKMGSLIFCPLIFENEVLGVITVQSKTKNAYSQYNFDTVKALASYIAIAIRNAQKSNALEKLNEILLKLSNLDGLTEIPNRRYFDKEVEVLWKSAKIAKQPLSLMLVDVDKFKQYNDNYGHLAGDYCLQRVAKILQAAAGEGDGFAARYGGDEFVVVLPNTSSEAACSFAEAMKNSVEALNIEHKFSKVANHVTLTIGVCTLIPGEELTLSSLTDLADKALYSAKQKGRNTIVSTCLSSILNICHEQ
jgi:diguanylate cyclase (GGDEF)-like protein